MNISNNKEDIPHEFISNFIHRRYRSRLERYSFKEMADITEYAVIKLYHEFTLFK